MDGMEIINLHKRCNKKARKTSQPKKAPKSDEEEQKTKKASRSSDGKNAAIKAGKKIKKTPQPKKAPKSPEFIDSSKEEEEPPKDDKEKKIPPLLRVKEEVQGLFDLRKESKNLTIQKKVKRVVFMGGPYEGYELSYVALYDTEYLRGVLKMSGLDKK